MYTKTKLRRAQDFAKFEEIYEKLETIYKTEFEETVRKKSKRLWIYLIFIAIAIFSFTIGFWKYSNGELNSTLPIMLLIFLLTIFIFMFIASPNEKNFCNNFKQRIIGDMLKQMHLNLTYSPLVSNKKDTLDSYKNLGFEPSNFGGEYVDDEITGLIYDNISINLCDLSIKKSTPNGTATLFNGIFAQLNLNKSIDADIRLLLPENHYLGNAKDVKKLQMDNTSFENLFNVYTNNKLITHQILTSEVMDQLRNYYEKYGMYFEVIVKNGKAGVRIETGPMFESFSTKNKLHKEDTFVYYSILNFTFELLKDIYNIIDKSDI